MPKVLWQFWEDLVSDGAYKTRREMRKAEKGQSVFFFFFGKYVSAFPTCKDFAQVMDYLYIMDYGLSNYL